MSFLPNVIGAHLLFEQEGHVLLGLRPPDALFAANVRHVPAGQEQCVEWRWWPSHALPDPTVPYTVAALEGMAHGRSYTDMGRPR